MRDDQEFGNMKASMVIHQSVALQDIDRNDVIIPTVIHANDN